MKTCSYWAEFNCEADLKGSEDLLLRLEGPQGTQLLMRSVLRVKTVQV